MSSAHPKEQARLERLLHACSRGLNHDLTNQLIVLRGLLQWLQHDEAEHLGSAGQDYIRRLLGVSERTQVLAHTLRDLSRLSAAPPPSETIALPVLIEEVVAELKAPPPCVYSWDAPRTFAPRPLLRQAVAVALSLLMDLKGQAGAALDFRSHPVGPAIELAIGIVSRADDSSAALPTPSALDLPATWHEKLDCVLLRELVNVWDGTVRWERDRSGVRVILPLPAPR